ncbi:MAG: sensor histidine kinase, partial [bacterium]|nr:sensor histidine kinase [bacterium]
RDDGVGVAASGRDAAGTRQGAGQGILGMEERARLLGGSVRIGNAAARKGTIVTARVPIGGRRP